MSGRAARGGAGGSRGDYRRGSSGLTSSRARFDARAARVRRRPWLLTVWVVALMSVLAGGVWLVEFSPVLVTRSVTVEGVPAGEVATVVRRAAVPMGTPLAKVDTGAIARRVVGSATLGEVTVTRSYPSTIRISGRPRVPVLAVRDPQGQVHVVDSQGVAYASVTKAPQGVPLIDSVESPPSLESMRAAMTVLGTLSTGQRHQVTNVTVLGPNMVTLKLGGVKVVWGGASEPELKVKVMTALLRQKGVQNVDVSAPHTPAIR